jgi:hypothetical protein
MPQTALTAKTWLSTTSQILYERPERLQHLVMQIADTTPEMGCYASDLARLRMSGLMMESALFLIWKADTAQNIDAVMSRFNQLDHPCAGAIGVMADLIKNDLPNREWPNQTLH